MMGADPAEIRRAVVGKIEPVADYLVARIRFTHAVSPGRFEEIICGPGTLYDAPAWLKTYEVVYVERWPGYGWRLARFPGTVDTVDNVRGCTVRVPHLSDGSDPDPGFVTLHVSPSEIGEVGAMVNIVRGEYGWELAA